MREIGSPDDSRLATVGEPLLKNPLRRTWQAMGPIYPVSNRFHYLEFHVEPGTPLFVLNKLHVSKKHSVVLLPGGAELGKLFFNWSTPSSPTES